MPDPLPQELAVALQSTATRRGRLGANVHYFTETGSTNDIAASLAEAGAPEGTLVVASSQTAGRGRLGRQWHSPPDAGLYVSLIMRSSRAAPYLTLAGGVAVARGITQATALPVQIKWPNDIIVPDRARPSRSRKLAGILAEASSGAEGVIYVILGFGINLRATAYPPELIDRATSIETELSRPVDGAAVLAETLAALNMYLSRLGEGDARRVIEDWRALSPLSRSGSVELSTPSGRLEGVAAGIDETGALLVRVGGRVERVIAGEVVWK
jgi:BirA family transcriptional regulator, biotin operon repressor / biotin---[acetyl-CoA-carboxylase] ligase